MPPPLLISTKLRGPTDTGHWVARERLLADLGERHRGRRCRACVISAAGGFGKTTLAAQWRDRLIRAGEAVSWLTLDPDDDNAERLCEYLLAAVHQAQPAVDLELASLLADRAPDAPSRVLTAVINAVAAAEARVTLIVDDCHHPATYFGGELRIDVDLARAAITEKVGRPLGVSARTAAEAMKVAWVKKIGDALRAFTPISRDTTLAAFGGAGPLFACRVAEGASIARVVIPGLAAVFSAFGVGFSDVAHERRLSGSFGAATTRRGRGRARRRATLPPRGAGARRVGIGSGGAGGALLHLPRRDRLAVRDQRCPRRLAVSRRTTVVSRPLGSMGTCPMARVVPMKLSPRYGESLHASRRGEWDYCLDWKPIEGFPVRAGWLRAIRQAHRRLHAGIDVGCLALVMCSSRSIVPREWDDALFAADAVLDVTQISRRADALGPYVTRVRIDGASTISCCRRPRFGSACWPSCSAGVTPTSEHVRRAA